MEASICWTLRKKEEENYPPNIIDSLPFPLFIPNNKVRKVSVVNHFIWTDLPSQAFFSSSRAIFSEHNTSRVPVRKKYEQSPRWNQNSLA
jgi:hypothetical protein